MGFFLALESGNNQRVGASYDAAGNMISDPAGPSHHTYTYDAAGDVTYDGSHHYTYDAEGRLQSVDGATYYVYDGAGDRVGETNSQGTPTAAFIYDRNHRLLTQTNTGTYQIVRANIYAGGLYMAEDSPDPVHNCSPSATATQLRFTDQVGSLRGLWDYCYVNYTASWDSFPYGDGAMPGDGGDAGPNYGGMLFTGKERDTESGLDNFGARYYSSNMGRFLSPDYSGDGGTDPEPVPWADYTDPQSLNLYSYVGNNPLTNTDPDGHDCIYANGDDAYVKSGDCFSDTDSGTYVNGTVTSANYNASNNSIGFTYTNDDTGNLGAGVIANVPTHQPMDEGAATPGDNGLGFIAGGIATDYVVGRVLGSIFGRGAGEVGSGIASQSPKLVMRAQQLTHAMRVEIGHNTPLGTPAEIKAAIEAALKAKQYTVSPGGVVTGNATIQGVAHEFTGFLQGNQVIFSNIYRQ